MSYNFPTEVKIKRLSEIHLTAFYIFKDIGFEPIVQASFSSPRFFI